MKTHCCKCGAEIIVPKDQIENDGKYVCITCYFRAMQEKKG